MAKIKRKPGVGWYAMSCEGGFLGTIWEGNSSGGKVRPRLAVVPSLNPPIYHDLWICHGDEECEFASKRSREVLGIQSRRMSIDFLGVGHDDAEIVLSGKGVQAK